MDNVQMWSDVEHILQADRLVFVLQKKIIIIIILYSYTGVSKMRVLILTRNRAC
jgi:hypothetical protein